MPKGIPTVLAVHLTLAFYTMPPAVPGLRWDTRAAGP
jgi:hypothetical protein